MQRRHSIDSPSTRRRESLDQMARAAVVHPWVYGSEATNQHGEMHFFCRPHCGPGGVLHAQSRLQTLRQIMWLDDVGDAGPEVCRDPSTLVSTEGLNWSQHSAVLRVHRLIRVSVSHSEANLSLESQVESCRMTTTANDGSCAVSCAELAGD
jgi:hypothetical protein